MNVSTTVTAEKSRLPYEGAHELSWAYVLDLIYSDAFHHGVGTLHFSVGEPALESGIRLRADVTSMRAGSTGVGVVQIVSGKQLNESLIHTADIVYTVEYGRVASKKLRSLNPTAPEHLKLKRQVSVFTWKARVLGIPIRLASQLNQPYLFDRLMKRMRSLFLTEGYAPAYYHLKVWNNHAKG